MLTASQRAARQRLRRFLLRLGERLEPMGCRVDAVSLHPTKSEGTLVLHVWPAHAHRFPGPFFGRASSRRLELTYMAFGEESQSGGAMALTYHIDTGLCTIKGPLGTEGETPERAVVLAASFDSAADDPTGIVYSDLWAGSRTGSFAPAAVA